MSWLQEATGLPPFASEIETLLEGISPMEVPEGTILFRPGETVKGFVILLEGQVDVYLTGQSGREILLYSVSPGQSCIQSTLGLLGGEEYSGEAIARSACRLVLVPNALFLTLMDRSTAFRGFVFSAFARRMQSMMHLLDQVAFQRVEARLARCLLDRAENGVLRATHADIAVMIGSAREVVSRRLDALARRGIVTLDRGQVSLRDPRSLEDMARDAK
ncbi:Crp/Fnr family transcriptional regulator [Roseovarius faecimaris]|uniref:Crp/Fnr family transcriptional regulator n=1 Tax=Roseovarius faecimaris TaxID=2494550 RepID=A0A6I6IRJ2_9RHOB|nr:Crp/Fnr family transcriptional regulator [Roseovarius faecimaris]QGX98704.1 Crp/Fnr family transcriptional regulator [Roseovarius faecimaris]